MSSTITIEIYIASNSSIAAVSATVQEYCVAETFQARCSHGDVIAMTTALFGRMKVGRCITSDAFQLQKLQPDSLGCSADVLEYFDRTCSGRSACDVAIPNPDLLKFRPCSAQLVVYLEASYSCVSGECMMHFTITIVLLLCYTLCVVCINCAMERR